MTPEEKLQRRREQKNAAQKRYAAHMSDEAKARRKEQQKRYRDNLSEEKKAEIAARQKAWAAANPEKTRNRVKKHRAANIEKVRESNRESKKRAWAELTEEERAAKNAYRKAWREANKEKDREARKRYYENNKEKIYGKRKTWMLENPEVHREKTLGCIWSEGQTYNGLFVAQHGECAICGQTLRPGKYSAVDHCHRTGYVRGILCTNCNNGLGRFMDNPALLRAAADYLDAHAARIAAQTENPAEVLNLTHVATPPGRS